VDEKKWRQSEEKKEKENVIGLIIELMAMMLDCSKES